MAAAQSSSISLICKTGQRSPNLATSYTVYFRVLETKPTRNRKDAITRNTSELSHTPALSVLMASPFASLRQSFHIPSRSYGPAGLDLWSAPVPNSLTTHARSQFGSVLLFPGSEWDTEGPVGLAEASRLVMTQPWATQSPHLSAMTLEKHSHKPQGSNKTFYTNYAIPKIYLILFGPKFCLNKGPKLFCLI